MPEDTHSERTPTPQPASASTIASIGRFTLPAKEFALAGLFECIPDARVECEPTIADPDDHVLMVIQTENHDHDVEAVLQADSDIVSAEYFGNHDDGQLYRVTWEGRPNQYIHQLGVEDITLLSAQGRDSLWQLRLLAPSREKLGQVYEILENLDYDDTVLSITMFNKKDLNQSGLTNKQREALVTAFEMGYYNIPRNVIAQDVADALDVSHQAISERFLRAYRQLIETHLIVTDEKYG